MIALARAKTPKLKPVSWVKLLVQHLVTTTTTTMESHAESKKVYQHYLHTDSCKDSRWNARECYEYMYGKPWRIVNGFYSDLVNGRSSLSELFGTKGQHEGGMVGIPEEFAPEASPSVEKSGRWARATFKIVVSYHGEYFDGWQRQPGLNSVQGVVERSIGTFVDDKKAKQLKDRGLPVEGAAVVAGRTDKGVTALSQVCSFYTWRKDVIVEDIERAINEAALGKLRVVSVSKVSRAFHPNFSAKWRRYLYIFPLVEGVQESHIDEVVETEIPSSEDDEDEQAGKSKILHNDKDKIDGVKKPTSFSVARVDHLLQQLQGKLLSYRMFARDTKASRNIGPPTECFMHHARAIEAKLPCSNEDKTNARNVMCVELVGNRFLRRMVRVLVATVVREAAAGAEDDVLLKLMDASCRRATAPPAPPDGLCLVDVGYSDFDPQKCFIQ